MRTRDASGFDPQRSRVVDRAFLEDTDMIYFVRPDMSDSGEKRTLSCIALQKPVDDGPWVPCPGGRGFRRPRRLLRWRAASPHASGLHYGQDAGPAGDLLLGESGLLHRDPPVPVEDRRSRHVLKSEMVQFRGGRSNEFETGVLTRQ